MNASPRQPMDAVFTRFARWAAGVTVLAGLAPLVGWATGLDALRNLLASTRPMNPFSGVAAVFGGIVVLLAAGGGKIRRRQRAVRLAGLLLALVGAVGLGDCLALWSARIDRPLFDLPVTCAGMHSSTAAGFLLLGSAICLLDVEISGGMRPAQWLAAPVLGLALFDMLGYVYRAPALFADGGLAAMSFPSSIALCALSLSVLCVRPVGGIMSLLAGDTIGGGMARRLLPALLLTLTVVGWLRLKGERLGLYGTAYGLALFTLANMAIFTALIVWVGRRMARIDVERQAAAQGLREAHDELERRVRSRTHDLVKVVEELREGIDVLASCSTEIMTVTRELADGANDIAVALSATASTVEEMRQMANVTSRQAAHVSETSERASGMSGRGKTSTGEVVAGMRRIQGDMEGIDASMIRLREQARAIGQIVATVDDLAAQSSVLAVNAAIEAAKAGSHGRGFAMVAREVKSLAQQSKQATRDVRSILVDIQKASRDALAATERGRQTVEEVGAQSVGAGESIDALAGSLAEAVQAATQIAASSRQQLVGADHVVMATARVQQIGGRYAAGTTKLEDAARALDVLGRRLKALVDTRKE